MFRLSQRITLMVAAVVLLWTAAAAEARRIALVIGNDAYQSLPTLEKAASDAKGYAELMRRKGFDQVIDRTNLTRQDMDIAIAEFLDAIRPGDTAVFVYSGHGWSDGSENYLVGVDAPHSAPQVLLSRLSIPLQNGVNGILDEIGQRGASLKVAIVDACRDNPFAPATAGRSIGLGRGLARVDPPSGTFVVFSAGAGQTALDRLSDGDPDPNGVFTRTFLPLLDADMPLLQAVKEAQQKVYKLARGIDHDQEPAYYDQVRGSACLSPSCDIVRATPAPTPAPVPPAPSTAMDREALFWSSIATSGNPADYDAYLKAFPDGVFAPLARNRLAALTPAPAPPEPDVSTTGTECDRLAASAYNPDNPRGISPVGVDALAGVSGAAIAACRAEIAKHPEIARFNFQLGRALHAGGQYAEARVWYQKAGDLGSALAMNNLGVLYENGYGVTKDPVLAADWYRRAADKGVPLAMSSLGRLYVAGSGVPQDYGQARRWLEKAAEAGETEGMYQLGLLYDTGNGGTKDDAEALRWYRKAADAGHRVAMRNLGVLYQYGRGAPQDYYEARRWFEKSADLGYNEAMTDLGLLYEFGNGVSQSYSEAARWYRKAADLGEPDGTRNLGVLYQNGTGVTRDYAEAQRLYRQSADAGDSIAMRNLGLLYQDGLGVGRDYGEARRWFEKAAGLGYNEAMTDIGLLYEYGNGVGQSYQDAQTWYRKAADLNEADGTRLLGRLYENGNGVPRDYVEARRWYAKAAELGDANAMTSLAALYWNGNGVAQDFGEVRHWYEKAAALGNATAMTGLGVLYDFGNGVREDDTEARRWYEQAAAQGELQAIHNLGGLLASGSGGPKDVQRASQLLIQALAGGYDWTFEQFRTNSNAYDVTVRRNVQQYLIDKGYLSGTADGVFGQQSRSALDAYQAAVRSGRS